MKLYILLIISIFISCTSNRNNGYPHKFSINYKIDTKQQKYYFDKFNSLSNCYKLKLLDSLYQPDYFIEDSILSTHNFNLIDYMIFKVDSISDTNFDKLNNSNQTYLNSFPLRYSIKENFVDDLSVWKMILCCDTCNK